MGRGWRDLQFFLRAAAAAARKALSAYGGYCALGLVVVVGDARRTADEKDVGIGRLQNCVYEDRVNPIHFFFCNVTVIVIMYCEWSCGIEYCIVYLVAGSL